MKTIEINGKTYEVVDVDNSRGRQLICEACAFLGESCMKDGQYNLCTSEDDALPVHHFAIFKEIKP